MKYIRRHGRGQRRVVLDVCSGCRQRSLSLSLPPLVERVKLAVDVFATALSSLAEIGDGLHDFRVFHISRLVVVLVNGKDAEV